MGDGPFMNMYMFVYLCVNVALSMFLCGYIMRSYQVQKPHFREVWRGDWLYAYKNLSKINFNAFT